MASDRSYLDSWLYPSLDMHEDSQFLTEGSLACLRPTPLALSEMQEISHTAHCAHDQSFEPSSTINEGDTDAPRHLSLDSEQAIYVKSSDLDDDSLVMDLSASECPKIVKRPQQNRGGKRPIDIDLQAKMQTLEKYPRLTALTVVPFGTNAPAVYQAPDLTDYHVCRICLKYFATVNQMRRHQAIDHGMKLYQCSKCDDSFRLESTLHIHEQSLHRYFCFQCGKTFTRSKKLAEHAEVSHGTYICDICFVPFSLKVFLEDHKMAGHRKFRK